MKKRPPSISRFSDPDILAEIAAHLDRNNVSTIEIETFDGELKIMSPVRSGQSIVPQPVVPQAAPVREEPTLARAPIAGIFLPAHPLRPEHTIQPGRSITEGEIVAFMKAGPVLTPVTAEKGGVVAAVTAEPGTLVGYGYALLKATAEW